MKLLDLVEPWQDRWGNDYHRYGDATWDKLTNYLGKGPITHALINFLKDKNISLSFTGGHKGIVFVDFIYYVVTDTIWSSYKFRVSATDDSREWDVSGSTIINKRTKWSDRGEILYNIAYVPMYNDNPTKQDGYRYIVSFFHRFEDKLYEILDEGEDKKIS